MASMQRVGQPTGGPPGGNGLPSPGANNGATGPGTPTSVGTQPPTPQTPTQGNMAALPQQGVGMGGMGGMGTPGQQQQIQQQGGAIPPQHHLHQFPPVGGGGMMNSSQQQMVPPLQQQPPNVQQQHPGGLPPYNPRPPGASPLHQSMGKPGLGPATPPQQQSNPGQGPMPVQNQQQGPPLAAVETALKIQRLAETQRQMAQAQAQAQIRGLGQGGMIPPHPHHQNNQTQMGMPHMGPQGMPPQAQGVVGRTMLDPQQQGMLAGMQQGGPQSQLPPQVQQQLQQVQQGGGGQLPPTNQQWGAGGPPMNPQQRPGMMGHMAGQQQPAVSQQQQQMMNQQQSQPGNRGLMQVTGISGGAAGATASLAAAAGAGNLPQAALQELLRTLRSPSSPLQQQQVLSILRANPHLIAEFIRQRAARYQGGQGGPGGVGGPPTGGPARVEFQGGRQQQAQGQRRKKTFNRGLIYVAEVVHGKLAISRTVVIHFSEAEATVEGISAKVREALGSEEGFTLTDSQGNEILDSEDTRSSQYWKQNSRKVFALLESEFRDFQSEQRAKRSRRAEDSDLQDVVHAAESLQGISDSISQLSEMVKKKVTEADVQPIKEAFTCLVCIDIMDEPTFSKCCSSLLGCGSCVRQWLLTSDHCLKCRSPNFKRNIHYVKGLDSALAFIK